MKVIHHNEKLNIVSLIERMSSSYINVDLSSYSLFLEDASEIHSFTSICKGKERIKEALNTIISDNVNKEIILKSKSAFVIILTGQNNDNPLSVSEIKNLSEFVEKYLKDKDILWGISVDQSLGDEVKVVLLTK